MLSLWIKLVEMSLITDFRGYEYFVYFMTSSNTGVEMNPFICVYVRQLY